jgi:hypothetical protein
MTTDYPQSAKFERLKVGNWRTLPRAVASQSVDLEMHAQSMLNIDPICRALRDPSSQTLRNG